MCVCKHIVKKNQQTNKTLPRLMVFVPLNDYTPFMDVHCKCYCADLVNKIVEDVIDVNNEVIR